MTHVLVLALVVMCGSSSHKLSEAFVTDTHCEWHMFLSSYSLQFITSTCLYWMQQMKCVWYSLDVYCLFCTCWVPLEYVHVLQDVV